MKKITTLLCVIFLIFGCRSLKVEQFQPKEKGNQLLPPMAFNCTANLKGDLFGNVADFEKEISKNVYLEFHRNISSNGANSVGFCDFQIEANFKNGGVTGLTTFVSIITLGGWLLIGAPWYPIKCNLKITATIKDSNDNTINYNYSTGQGKAWIAAYWGYSGRNALRKSYLQALQIALRDLGKKIQLDYSIINTQLLNTPKHIESNYTNSKQITIEQNTSKNISFNNSINSEQQNVMSDVDFNIPVNTNSKTKTYALIIGNEDYSSFQKSLANEINVDFAKNDATIFKEYCNKTLGLPEKNIELLINATGNQIYQKLDKLSLLAKSNDGNAELIFYYAGHGLPDEITKEPYIIPVDVNGRDLKYAIKLIEIYKKLTENPTKKVTVFLDACFSGGARNQNLVALRGVKIKPKDNIFGNNLIVFTSSSGEESSASYKEKGHGMFTYYLLKALQDSNGSITYNDLKKYLESEIKVNSVLINDKQQTPQIIGSPDLQEKWLNWKL